MILECKQDSKKQTEKLFYVQIIEDSTGEVEKEYGPYPERVAKKVELGVMDKIDYDRFHTVMKQR